MCFYFVQNEVTLVVIMVKNDLPTKQLFINLLLCYIVTKYWIKYFCQLVFFQ